MTNQCAEQAHPPQNEGEDFTVNCGWNLPCSRHPVARPPERTAVCFGPRGSEHEVKWTGSGPGGRQYACDHCKSMIPQIDWERYAAPPEQPKRTAIYDAPEVLKARIERETGMMMHDFKVGRDGVSCGFTQNDDETCEFSKDSISGIHAVLPAPGQPVAGATNPHDGLPCDLAERQRQRHAKFVLTQATEIERLEQQAADQTYLLEQATGTITALRGLAVGLVKEVDTKLDGEGITFEGAYRIAIYEEEVEDIRRAAKALSDALKKTI